VNTITTTLTASLFTLAAAGASAADVYQGLGAGHPDLNSQPQGRSFATSAMQPGVGSQIDRYQGIAEGNVDLFNVRLDGPAERSGKRPVIYSGAQGNPDLSF